MSPYLLKDNATFAGLKINGINRVDKTEHLKEALSKYNSYDEKIWRRDYFNKENGGYLTVDRERIEHSKISKNEKAKFYKEHAMSMVFAQNGYTVEMLKERPGFSSSDITIDGIKAELKKTTSHNNILNYAKKATGKQGAEMVLFEFATETAELQKELLKLKNQGMKAFYFFTGREDKIYRL